RDRYRAAPSVVWAKANARAPTSIGDTITVRLAYRTPFDFAALLAFLSARAIVGVEHVDDASFATTLSIGGCAGWLSVVDDPTRAQLVATLSSSLAPALLGVVSRLRALFDLDARPHDIATALARDPFLAREKQRFAGLRVPGTTSGFTLAVRAVLGQQVSVKAATTLMARLVTASARPIDTPVEGLTRLPPTPEDLLAIGVDAVAACGIVRARAETVLAIAELVHQEPQLLEPYADAARTDRALGELAGMGPWTRGYIALRALRDPDAYPVGDLVLCKRVGGATTRALAQRAETWRPWRAYAAMWLWARATNEPGEIDA
ncbi:MAG: DNA-3-methyladenine glycosylase family protein, partial [Polyangiales bacterium]